MRNLDFDHDGIVSQLEIDRARDMLEINLREEKADTQRRMAWIAMCAIIIFTITLFSPIVTDQRVKALADLLGLFYISMAGIVGAFMGVTAWMSNNSTSSSRAFTYNQQAPIKPIADDSEGNA